MSRVYWLRHNIILVVGLTVIGITFVWAGFAIDDNIKNPTVYDYETGIVIDIKDNWSGRYAIINLDNDRRISEFCSNCIIGDIVNATISKEESKIVWGVRIIGH